MAVAVTCHALGVNPFDQPQVEEAKQTTSQLLARGVREQPPDWIDDGDPTAVIEGLEAGQYLGLLAYVDPRPDNGHRLRKVREAMRDASGSRPRWASVRATCTRPASSTRAGHPPGRSSRSSTRTDTPT